jgi:hypothetical protein
MLSHRALDPDLPHHLDGGIAGPICACPICSAAATAIVSEPLYGLNAADRGETGPNAKPSLTVAEAAVQLTRDDASWNGTGVLGRAATVTYGFRDTAPATMRRHVGFIALYAAQIRAGRAVVPVWATSPISSSCGGGHGDRGRGPFSGERECCSRIPERRERARLRPIFPRWRQWTASASDSWLPGGLCRGRGHLNYNRLS